ncbi:MAG: hypothetical protein VR65_23145 [Desulfobulbaceae bacterium BRH_c16a]|nr:MAG: hypothetical protein VR65_23145 [Desulfobulbaceae bacterium BRH_c16a]
MKTDILQHVPSNPDITKHYLFYLHGLIVELAGIRPRSEEHGYYEYEGILEALAEEGFIVISESREKDTEIKAYAEKIASQVKTLLANSVPPGNITVVGASKGGIISAYVSNMLRAKEINFVFLAGLFEKCLTDETLKLSGNVLSIHDRADTQSITPALYFQRSDELGKTKEIVLDLGLGHGLIYRPYREWLDPLVEWVTK